jgi:hypothetical protein
MCERRERPFPDAPTSARRLPTGSKTIQFAILDAASSATAIIRNLSCCALSEEPPSNKARERESIRSQHSTRRHLIGKLQSASIIHSFESLAGRLFSGLSIEGFVARPI